MKTVHVLSTGQFGDAVMRYLRLLQLEITGVHANAAALVPNLANVEMIVAILWRPDDQLCELLNSLSYQAGIPFVASVVEGKFVSVGPVVTQGDGSCWVCWAKRCRQHDPWLRYRLLLRAHYQEDTTAGPKGYLAPIALMVASLLAQIVTSLRANHKMGGTLWKIDMVNLTLISSSVVGVHGCSYCGLNRNIETRSYRALRQSLSDLWRFSTDGQTPP